MKMVPAFIRQSFSRKPLECAPFKPKPEFHSFSKWRILPTALAFFALSFMPSKSAFDLYSIDSKDSTKTAVEMAVEGFTGYDCRKEESNRGAKFSLSTPKSWPAILKGSAGFTESRSGTVADNVLLSMDVPMDSSWTVGAAFLQSSLYFAAPGPKVSLAYQGWTGAFQWSYDKSMTLIFQKKLDHVIFDKLSLTPQAKLMGKQGTNNFGGGLNLKLDYSREFLGALIGLYFNGYYQTDFVNDPSKCTFQVGISLKK